MKGKNITHFFTVILLVGLLLSLIPLVVFAQENELITTRSEFEVALRDANDGDTILVGDIDFNLQATGDVNEGERIIIDKSVTVKNGKASGNAVFTGASFILSGTKVSGSCTSFLFENIVFDEGLDTASLTPADWETSAPSKYPSKAQYAIECRGNTSATFTNCDFKNYMHVYGAAIRAYYADYSSTAEFIEEHGNNAVCELKLYLNNCSFDSNAALRDGGAIFIDACSKNVSLFATSCRFDKNKSGVNEHESGGGAIYLQDAVSEFVGCRFIDNQANYLYGGECPINDTQSGGAIYCGGNGEITVRQNTFVNNKASCGGAVAICNTSRAFFEDCIITENKAVPVSDNSDGNKGIGSNKGLGGAIYTDGRVSVSINNTEIRYNYAENALGAICNRYMPGISTNASISLHFCTIADNKCRFARTDYMTYDKPGWIWYRYPGDVFDIPTVELFGCLVVDDMYEQDIPRHEQPSEENGYNYFGSTAPAEWYNEEGHLVHAPEVSTDFIKEKLGDRNYYGSFTVGANNHDVTFRFFMDGVCKETATLPSGTHPTRPAFEKTGYTLTSWTLAEDFDYQADRYFIVGNETGSVDFHAVFTPNVYDVTFDFGNAQTVTVQQTYDTPLAFPEAIEKSGYSFDGWYIGEDKSGGKIEDGEIFTYAGDITYYAFYEKDFPLATVLIIAFEVLLVGGLAALAIVVFKRKEQPVVVVGEPAITAEKELPDTSMLSPREKEVLDLLLEGKQRNEIAAMLYISENTVKKQITSIYAKLGVASRNELFALFK